MIFYLLTRSDFESSGETIAAPGGDGFVHCCDETQISDVRTRYFPADAEVVALAFDPTRLSGETRYEPGSAGEPERFPHVHGELPRGLVAFIHDA